jgi:hypothetical protein
MKFLGGFEFLWIGIPGNESCTNDGGDVFFCNFSICLSVSLLLLEVTL